MNLEDLTKEQLKEYSYLVRNFELLGLLATDNEITFTIEPYINKKGVFKYRVLANCNYTEEEALSLAYKDIIKNIAYPLAEAKELYITGTYSEIVRFIKKYKAKLNIELRSDFINFFRGLTNGNKKRNN